MKSARLIVCDKNSDWAVALRRELPVLRVTETRSLSQLWSEAELEPLCFVVIVTTAENAAAVVELLGKAARQFHVMSIVVVTSSVMRNGDWLFLEAGARLVVRSTRQATEVAKMATRHFAELPPVDKSITDRIMDELPWS